MTVDQIFSYLIVAAIAGAGMVTGLLFAFSNFIMRALAELPSEHGIRTYIGLISITFLCLGLARGF